MLAEHFLDAVRRRDGRAEARPHRRARCELLEGHAFPGNVRELKNMIERALIESGGEPDRAGAPAPHRTVACVACRPRAGRTAASEPAAEPRSRRAGADPARAARDRRQRRGGGAAARRESQPHLPEVPSRRRLLTMLAADQASALHTFAECDERHVQSTGCPALQRRTWRRP